jgi:TPR repeat protein
MARLTPLSKGLIGLAVIGAMASAVWNFALKDSFGPAAPPPTATTTSPSPSLSPSQAPATSAISTPPPPSTPPAPVETPAAVSNSGSGLSPAEHAAQGRQLMANGDFAQARRHLEQAVEGGDAGAACHLGEMTLKGQGGLTANQDAAAKLFQLAQSRNTICFAPGQ